MFILLCDWDGVAVLRHKMFSERLVALGVPKETVDEFFRTDFKLCSIGKLSLREILPKWIQKWGLGWSVDDVLKFWFEGENTLNQPVLDLVEKLKAKGVRVFAVTDQEQERWNYLYNQIGLSKWFTEHNFVSFAVGHKKNSREFWDYVINVLGVDPSELYYVDDDPENTELAAKLGIDSHTYTEFERLEASLLGKVEAELAS